MSDVHLGHKPISLVSRGEPLLRKTVGVVACEDISCVECENCHGDTGSNIMSTKCEQYNPDPCHPNPCQGGGQCVRGHKDSFQCKCTVYKGQNLGFTDQYGNG